jgi:hypothetical protein
VALGALALGPDLLLAALPRTAKTPAERQETPTE